jgi:hypothetical protein
VARTIEIEKARMTARIAPAPPRLVTRRSSRALP